MSDLPKQYNPQSSQSRWSSFWEQRGYFNADPNPNTQQHTIMIPLPNVTGALHMGHALNGTLQDLITRWRRMQGYEALWMPGTDHAGIATQAVVERRMLEEEGLTRHDVGREALVQRIWKWKDQYEQRILNQLKQLGASCDWRRTRFTLDDVCSKAVRRTFFKLFQDGLIYRGQRLVNWDTFLQTAVADDEVFEEEVAGHFWTFNYPLVDEAGRPTGEKISFATTRPETMLGDTAVCVHPSDERYRHLVGKKVRIPLNGRNISIIADALLADPEMGTGAVKVTPAHDSNDYACGQRNNLQMINILNLDGTVNGACNNEKYVGHDRYEVREMVTQDMQELGHYEGVEDRQIPIKHSDRSKTPVEPCLSDQWFVKMDDLAQSAMDAVQDGRVTFFPSRYAKTYLDWLGEKRDWCISRQLWWGHRIPVWSKTVEREYNKSDLDTEFDPSFLDIDHTPALKDKFKGKIWFQRRYDAKRGVTTNLACLVDEDAELEAILESVGYVQDPDVLDTWFSSALWPHATLGWPNLEHNPPLDQTVVDKQTRIQQGTDAPRSPAENPKSEIRNPKSQNEVLNYFYPGSVLITSRDIITLWVARMVLTGLYNMGDVPFRHVHVHPKILDGYGQTMSKSKGNGVNPLDLIDRYGTDAVRFTIASFAGETQDVRLPIGYECPHCQTVIPQTLEHQKARLVDGENPTVKCPQCNKPSQFSSPNFEPDQGEPLARMVSQRFEYGRNFCNKLWNAARFVLINLEEYTPGRIAEDDLTLEDRWILSRLSSVTAEVTEQLGRYQFDFATRSLREFIWNEFCDWYLEMVKLRLHDDGQKPLAQRVLVGVLDAILRLLQPLTPFIAEDLWQRLNEVAPERGLLAPQPAAESIMIAPWPELPAEWQQDSLERRFERLQETIAAVRNVRAVYRIGPRTPLKLYVRCGADVAAEMRDVSSQFENLAKTTLETVGAEVQRPKGSASFALGGSRGFIPLEGIIDLEAEQTRLHTEADKLCGFIAGYEKKLANENFVIRAPENVVNDVRDTLAEQKKKLASLEQIIRELSVD